MIDKTIFRAYDIRGIYPSELNEEVAYLVGRAFITLTQAQEVVVGHDMRLSSPPMGEALIRGILNSGADVLLAGLVSTDQFYHACATLDLPGVMVTASHNPKDYGGFKMVKRMPHMLSGNGDIQTIIENSDFSTAKSRGSVSQIDLTEQFIEKVLSLIDIETLTDLKVIADAGNGMVGPILKRVYDRLPKINLIGMYLDPDGNVPNHGLDPMQPENRAELQQRVQEENAQLGFAFDGDGDRFFAIDDRGKFVPGDFITALLGEYLLEKNPGARVIYDVRASWAVKNRIGQAGGIPVMERVGHAFIKPRMEKENAIFGGEGSGHYYFRDFYFADSGIIPSLLLMEMLSKKKLKLSELIEPLEAKYITSGELSCKISDDRTAIEKMKEIEDFYGKSGKVNKMDGLSIDFEDWHFSVRKSNTEPKLRLNVEAVASFDRMVEGRDALLSMVESTP